MSNDKNNNPIVDEADDVDYIIMLHEGKSHKHVANENSIKVRGLFTAFNGFHGKVPKKNIEKLKKDPRVKHIEPDVEVTCDAQSVSVSLKRIGADKNPIANVNGIDERVNVDVAVLDTGIDLTHPDLNVVAGVDFTGNNTGGDDNNGHGSNVAGIIGAIDNGNGVVGVAPGARLWAVKILNQSGSGTLSGMVKGVQYVTANANKISVANMSAGGVGSSLSLRTAIQQSVAAGVVYVVSAGNNTRDVYGPDGKFGTFDDTFPASYPETMTVSAMVATDAIPGNSGSSTTNGPDDTIAKLSNYSTNVIASNPVNSPGLAIDVAAPGVSVYSTYKDGGYRSYTGTSQAAPHVAGVVALYIAQNGRATNSSSVYSIRQTLINKAQPQAQWGRIQPCAYVSSRNGFSIVTGKEPLIQAMF